MLADRRAVYLEPGMGQQLGAIALADTKAELGGDATAAEEELQRQCFGQACARAHRRRGPVHGLLLETGDYRIRTRKWRRSNPRRTAGPMKRSSSTQQAKRQECCCQDESGAHEGIPLLAGQPEKLYEFLENQPDRVLSTGVAGRLLPGLRQVKNYPGLRWALRCPGFGLYGQRPSMGRLSDGGSVSPA